MEARKTLTKAEREYEEQINNKDHYVRKEKEVKFGNVLTLQSVKTSGPSDFTKAISPHEENNKINTEGSDEILFE